mgnify:CR=1 FL=1
MTHERSAATVRPLVSRKSYPPFLYTRVPLSYICCFLKQLHSFGLFTEP